MNFQTYIKGKKVLVFGLGTQGGGIGDALWLNRNGAIVKVTDAKSADELTAVVSALPAEVSTTLGRHTQEDIDWAQLIIKNPGVPDNHELLLYAKSLGVPVMTSIAVFVREVRDRIIGITGTRGKSTTTELIYQLLSSVYPGQVIKGGNIPGTSGLSLFDEIEGKKYAVLELSSFQLHNFHELHTSPHIAVFTNLYPDHLNRYTDIQAYLADKKAIYAYQSASDFIITNITDTYLGQHRTFSPHDVPTDWKIHLPGSHNLENIAALIQLAHVMNISMDQVKNIVEHFHGLPFRLENRGTKKGITYINDSTSTTPIATIKAIESMTQPAVLILGGPTKNLPIDELIEIIKSSEFINNLVILGSDSNTELLTKLRTHCNSKIIGQAHSMDEAVAMATRVAVPGGVVLLSPGFFSFDLFQNEFDRGRKFNDAVERLN